MCLEHKKELFLSNISPQGTLSPSTRSHARHKFFFASSLSLAILILSSSFFFFSSLFILSSSAFFSSLSSFFCSLKISSTSFFSGLETSILAFFFEVDFFSGVISPSYFFGRPKKIINDFTGLFHLFFSSE